MSQTGQVSVSYSISVSRLPQNGMPVTLKASAKELSNLAKAYDLADVLSFSAELLVKKWRRDGVSVSGLVKADIIQNCIVSLEPLEAHIESAVDAIFVPENSKLARIPLSDDGELVINFEGPDIPDTFTGDSIDIGALAEENFALAIDPYPRKDNAVFTHNTDSAPDLDKKPSPFAALINLGKK